MHHITLPCYPLADVEFNSAQALLSNHLPRWPWLETMAKSFLVIFCLETTNSFISPSSLSSQLHVTMVMTLRLAKKALIQSFVTSELRNLQPGPDQQSSFSFAINGRDPLRDSSLRKSQLPPFASSWNAFTQSSRSVDVCPPTDQWMWIVSTLQAWRFSNSPPIHFLSEFFHPKSRIRRHVYSHRSMVDM
jgi:hypothetical protein